MTEVEILKLVYDELDKLDSKYKKKGEKERAKINDIYVIVSGDKCYTEQDILDYYQCDYITSSQCDKYTETLVMKKKRAGENNSTTPSERVCIIVKDLKSYLYEQIRSIEVKEEEKRKLEERWEIAQMQGLSYSQFLELEEISKRSEEYEILMGIRK